VRVRSDNWGQSKVMHDEGIVDRGKVRSGKVR